MAGTQTELPETQLEISDEEDEESQHEVLETDEGSRRWGSLLPHDGRDQYDLVRATTFGRHPNQCDIVVTDNRVSATHCRITCEQDPSVESGHVIRLENMSQNKTFVLTSQKKLLRLNQGENRQLASGEQISLLNPKKFPDELLKTVTWTFLSIAGTSAAPTEAHGASATAVSSFGEVSGDATGDGDFQLLEDANHVSKYYDVRFSEEVGRGQYGIVYKAIERATGEPYACKVLDIRKAELAGSPIDMNEVDVTKGVSHPNIISTRAVFRDDSSVYIIQPLMLGGDLFDRIASCHPTGYPEASARLLMKQLVAAVGYLHDRDIVHRDLKPENILLESLESDTKMRIADFGLSKKGKACKTFCGTPQYFAPEVLHAFLLSVLP